MLYTQCFYNWCFESSENAFQFLLIPLWKLKLVLQANGQNTLAYLFFDINFSPLQFDIGSDVFRVSYFLFNEEFPELCIPLTFAFF